MLRHACTCLSLYTTVYQLYKQWKHPLLLQLTIIKVSSSMKSKPLSPPPAICGSSIIAQGASLFCLLEGTERKQVSSTVRVRVPRSTCFHSCVMEVEWTVCDRKQTGSWKKKEERERGGTCALQSPPVKTLLTTPDSWQLLGNWGQLKEK